MTGIGSGNLFLLVEDTNVIGVGYGSGLFLAAAAALLQRRGVAERGIATCLVFASRPLHFALRNAARVGPSSTFR